MFLLYAEKLFWIGSLVINKTELCFVWRTNLQLLQLVAVGKLFE